MNCAETNLNNNIVVMHFFINKTTDAQLETGVKHLTTIRGFHTSKDRFAQEGSYIISLHVA